MALHNTLPIYKIAYDLLGLAADLTANMRRDYKASVGAKIREECIEILVLILRANVAREKTVHLVELLERLQVAELLIRLSHDKHLISDPQYARAIALTTSVGKQANGWRKYAAASSPAA